MGRGDSRITSKMKRRKAQTRLKSRIARRQEEKQSQAKPKAHAVAPTSPIPATTKVRKRATTS